MADYEQEESMGFKVSDKRRFSADGTGTTEPQEQPEKSGEQKEPSAAKKQPDEGHKKRERARRGPVEFSGLITSLAQTALFQLGLVRTPDMKDPMDPDLDGASQTIDIIAMLEQKTRGNLTEQEKKLIDETLFQLRMAFVEMSK
ncbi:MAG: DUF1844 domain-containing protein [Desulfomonilaceae bacterium]